MATIVPFKLKQVNPDGSIIVYHVETSADMIKDSATKKVPLIVDITNWNNIKNEVITARGVEITLDARLDKIDEKLLAESILAALKTVDGSASGLDAQYVAGCEVNDAGVDGDTIWTAAKIIVELAEKLNADEVVTTAAANKVLRLNANGALPTSITGNAASASKLVTTRTFTFTGDVSGETTFDGSTNFSIELTVADNSHKHKEITYAGPTGIETTAASGNITEFKSGGAAKSAVDYNGNFTGSAAKVGGKTVDDAQTSSAYLWTAAKVLSALGGSVVETGAGKLEVGGTKILYGTVDMANVTTKVVTFSEAFTSVPVVVSSDETADFTWIYKKKPNSTTTTQVEFIANKPIASAKITWVAMGV